MPNLRDSLRTNLSGFESVSARPPLPPQAMPGKGNFGINPSIRCPLPPFNVNVDTLRQFDQSEGTGPKRRVVPLPSNMDGGGKTTVIDRSTVVSGGSGGSSSTTGVLTAKAVVYTSPMLAVGDFDTQSIAMAKVFQLISCSANEPCEMRLYGSASAQGDDSNRSTDVPLPAELANNLITDIVFDTPPYTWFWQNRVGANDDSPQSTNTYITVFNTSSGPAMFQIAIVFLPLEA